VSVSLPRQTGRALPPTLVLLTGSTLWGLTWLPLKAIGEMGMNPIATTLIAYLAAFAVILPFALRALARHKLALPWRGLALLALFGGSSALFFVAALMEGSVVRAMMLFFLIPAWGVIFGWLFLKEALTPARLLAVLLALSGAFLILGPGQILHTQWQWADLYAVLAGLTLALSNVVFRYLAAHPIPIKLLAMQAGSVLLASLALLILPASAAVLAPSAFTQMWPGLLGAALYGTTILLAAILCTQYAVHRLPVSRVAILMTMELIVSVLSATLVGGERPLLLEWVGGGLILIAALLEARQKTPSPRPLATGHY